MRAEKLSAEDAKWLKGLKLLKDNASNCRRMEEKLVWKMHVQCTTFISLKD